MTDTQAIEIARAVNTYLEAEPPFDVGNPTHFEGLVRCVGKLCPASAPVELEAVVALCVLGPGSAIGTDQCALSSVQGTPDVPPAAVRKDFWSIVQQYRGARGGAVMQLAVAYGCGKWRTVSVGVESWHGRWACAVNGLARAMVPGAVEVLRWLGQRVVGLRQGLEIKARGDTLAHQAWRHAHLVALKLCEPAYTVLLDGEGLCVRCEADGVRITGRLIQGNCYDITLMPGAKFVLDPDGDAILLGPKGSAKLPAGARVVTTAGDGRTLVTAPEHSCQVKLGLGQETSLLGCQRWQIWECACGHRCCPERHRLNGWNPAGDVELWSFAASALKGPLPDLCINSYVQGMSYPVLVQRGFC